MSILIGKNGPGILTLLEASTLYCGFNPRAATGTTRRVAGPMSIRCSTACALLASRRCRWASSPGRLRRYYIDAVHGGTYASHGGKSQHHQSHGEAFLALLVNRLGGGGMYIFEEPEAALSPARQMDFLS
jgi:predicted ATPase